MKSPEVFRGMVMASPVSLTACWVSPNTSPICVVKMVTAIPAVKPMIMGYGMNLMTAPNLNNPSAMSITPAIMVATSRPCNPYAGSVTIP